MYEEKAGEDLRSRLAQAEEIIGAIRDNEVDAVVGQNHVAMLRLREAEEALRESEARYRAIVEDQTEQICRWRPDGKISFVNSACCRCYGLEPEELLTRRFPFFISEEDRDVFDASVAGLDPQHPVVSAEYRVILPDGNVMWQQWTHHALFDPDGEVVEYQSVGRDITERTQAEEALRELNETLEARVAERTATAEKRAAQLRALAVELSDAEERERRRIAQILHDHLQQLLVAAQMQTHTLGRRIEDEALVKSAERVAEVLGESIDACRSLAVELSPPILHKEGLIAALDWLSGEMERQHELNVALRVEGTQEPVSDLRAMLFSAVRELLFNVVKHAGTKEASVTVVCFPGEVVRVEVRDEGAGFDIAKLEAAGQGEHLGLFSIRERIHWLGGQVDVESAPGAGTRVSISLPLQNIVVE